ncbi:MAG: hypothetical protein D6731_22510 [Planctomycetota bacterium]|nr:MAG: hypothetical protein D6731_22510 [Planctomycetota bacterium]
MLAPLVLVLVLVACRARGVAPTARDRPPEPAATGDLVVENHSGQTVFRLQALREGEGEWSEDLLASDEVLGEGARRRWPVACGRYRVRAELADGRAVELRAERDLGPDEEVVLRLPSAEASRRGTLTLVNATGYTIARVQFSPTNSMRWGEDRLGPKEVLAPGRSRSWQIPAGRYNVRVYFQDRTVLEARRPIEVTVGERCLYRLER